MTNLIFTKTQELISNLIKSNSPTVIKKQPEKKFSYFFKKVEKSIFPDINEINQKITDKVNNLFSTFTKPLEPKYQNILKSNLHAQFYANYYEIISEGKKQIAIKSQYSAKIKEAFNEMDYEAASSAQKEIQSIKDSIVMHSKKLATLREKEFVSDKEIATIETFISLKNEGLKIKLNQVNDQDSGKEEQHSQLISDDPTQIVTPMSFTYNNSISLTFGLMVNFKFEQLSNEEQKELSRHIEHKFSSFYQEATQANTKNTHSQDNKVGFFAKQPIPAATITNYFSPINSKVVAV